ncbi:MAG: nitroreductase family protein [Tissierellia bacterium]|nr:nitroreductase family protein [Tissierellia bacterium]
MDIITAIMTRRSIRRYSKREVSEEQVMKIVKSGMAAPTSMDRRPCHFIVVRDKEKLATLSRGNQYVGMMKDSQGVILVCGDNSVEPTRENIYIDCSAAMENMLLCTHGMGLGGVWCGINSTTDWYGYVIREFNLPEHIIPVGLMVFGYPDEQKPARDLWETEKVHMETWNSKK